MIHDPSLKASAMIAKTAYQGACQALEELDMRTWRQINTINNITTSPWARDNEELMRTSNWERYARKKESLQKKAFSLIKLSGMIDEKRHELRQQYLNEIGAI